MKLKKMISSRVVITILLIAIQAVWLLVSFTILTRHATWIRVILSILSLLMILVVIKKDENPTYKIGWILIIMTAPIFGGLFYLFFSRHRPIRWMRRKLEEGKEKIQPHLLQEQPMPEGRAAATMRYIQKYGPYPVWNHTETRYYPVGEEMYAAMLEDMKVAQYYIFLEYFIIREGRMWSEILEVLKEKAKQGVEIRLIYDDFGSLGRIPDQYYKELESYGIKAMSFNPLVPFISFAMNNRDHRKILVIDGHTAYNGGINLSDEYINHTHPLGHFKDTGVRYHGEAVWNFTLMFLEMWNAFRPEDEAFDPFMPQVYHPEPFEGKGWVQPFSDSPLDNETVAENVYMELIAQAERYVDIYTPYMAIDNEMQTALCMAAKRGVCVRLLLPAKSDSRITQMLSYSYLESLMEAGVHVFEYTPGFVHAKCFVVDDKLAVVGTINMDYRSLYLHFECGAFHYQTEAVAQLKKDTDETFGKSRELTLNDCKTGFFRTLFYAVLRVLAPLM